MNLYHFLHQNHKQRAAYTRAKGELLIVRESGAYNICLYSVENFFAEVWHRIADNEIELVRGFRSTHLLAPYLEMIDLDELVSI
ncbi:hypothetical protein [Adhaeribacter pallidiroseus]|uniref:Uncharacterized protein n=1 Tax=Adhaeribacter pallidiroseus TaxID=2072847 RepID=A0A369QKV2_9BACT|nr:hypothetical protein [Adhaeribacter pallidiroseus]RDC65012.1 hypothetical protein AHMF7616_03635 [Adhaeribacter pallidiroseus]